MTISLTDKTRWVLLAPVTLLNSFTVFGLMFILPIVAQKVFGTRRIVEDSTTSTARRCNTVTENFWHDYISIDEGSVVTTLLFFSALFITPTVWLFSSYHVAPTHKKTVTWCSYLAGIITTILMLGPMIILLIPTTYLSGLLTVGYYLNQEDIKKEQKSL